LKRLWKNSPMAAIAQVSGTLQGWVASQHMYVNIILQPVFAQVLGLTSGQPCTVDAQTTQQHVVVATLAMRHGG
jgi:hypothetical protein